MQLVFDYLPTADRPADRQELERLEQLVACLQLFVGHELPNTLVPVQGFARMLAEQTAGCLDGEDRMLVDRLAALARKADVWSRRLAELTRLLREPPGGPPVSLAEVVREAAAEAAARLASPPPELRVAGPLPAVPLGRPLLNAVVVQLFSNAVQAAPPGRPAALLVAATPAPSGTWLTIGDEGRGMTEGQLKLLQEPFAAGRQPGAAGPGLGFFLVRQAVARWGGAIRVNTEPGRGTTVALLLPTPEEGPTT